MSTKKDNRYKNVKKALMASASGGIMAGMLIVGAGSTVYAETSSDVQSLSYSQNSSATGMHLMHRWNSPAKINSLALDLGLDPNQVKEELKSGKTLKQILQENGIVPVQIQKAFKHKKMGLRR